MNDRIKGLSLVEVLLAGTLFVVVAVGIMAVLLNSREASRATSFFNRAILMSEEGKDVLKAIRDRDFNALTLGSNQALVFEDSEWRLKQDPLESDDAFGELRRRINISPGVTAHSRFVEIEIHFEGRGGLPVVFSIPLELWNTSFSKFVDVTLRSENYNIVDDSIGRYDDEFCYGCE